MENIDEALKRLGIGLEDQVDPLKADWPEKVRRRFETLNQEIIDATPLKSGELRQSAHAEVPKVNGSVVTFQLKIASYYKYTDQGVAGTESGSSKAGYSFTTKRPPSESLKQWANMTGINVWALQTHIFKHGIKGTEWYSKVVSRSRLDKLKEDIAKDFKDAILGR